MTRRMTIRNSLRKTISFSLFTIILGATPAIAGIQFADEVSASFSDWQARCSKAAQFCTASTFVNPTGVDDDGIPDYELRLSRNFAPGAHLEITFIPVISDPDPERPIGVQVLNMANQAYYPGQSWDLFGAVNHHYFYGPQAQITLDNMIAGNQLRISFLDAHAEPIEPTFSLSGLSATLLWIEEQQGKIGQPRLAGDTPFTAKQFSPASKQDMILSGGFPARLIAKHEAETTDCDALSDGTINIEQGSIATLSPTSTLYILPCFNAAYNSGFRLYVADTGEIGGYRTQYFTTRSANGAWTATDVIIGARFDTEIQTLLTYSAGRGLADCGSAASYRWNDWQFELAEYRDKPTCDEQNTEFPIVYSAPAKTATPE